MHKRGPAGKALIVAAVYTMFAVSAWAQTPAAESKKGSAAGEDVAALKQMVLEQQRQIEALQSAVTAMKQMLTQTANTSQAATARSGSVGEVASTTPVVPRSLTQRDHASDSLAVAGPMGVPAAHPIPGETGETSPLQLRVGNAYITPVGFMDFTSVWRNHDGGSGIGTNFASIPYGNSYATNLSEFRLSMQNSRIGFRVDANVRDAHVIGYMESDFLGNNPPNAQVSSNSNTLRSRLYWVDVRRDKWEVLGGQTWSLLTPGRSGISPLPGDLFFSQNIDVNYQAGLVWGRIPELRFVYHPSKKVAFALAVDSPEQYVGGSAGGGTVAFPAALSSVYGNELNTGSNGTGVPNMAPDFIAKLAFDPSNRFHVEVGGVERNFKVWNPANSADYSASGGGGFLNANVEVFKGFRLLTNNFISDGGGRYIFGQAPDLIAHADGSISLIHAASTVSGFEATHKNSLLYAYYGGIYVGRNTAIDAGGKPVGYGFTGSANGQNRAIQEGTLGLNQTVWKDPKWGAINLMGQYSYLTRNPWYVASGQPSNASVNMIFLDLRYTLPGSAPTLGK